MWWIRCFGDWKGPPKKAGGARSAANQTNPKQFPTSRFGADGSIHRTVRQGDTPALTSCPGPTGRGGGEGKRREAQSPKLGSTSRPKAARREPRPPLRRRKADNDEKKEVRTQSQSLLACKKETTTSKSLDNGSWIREVCKVEWVKTLKWHF